MKYKVYSTASLANDGENAEPKYIINAVGPEEAVRTVIQLSDYTTTRDDWVVKQ